ncbi:hypothetical protein CBW46_013195 [Paenibacillus xerothermodurans]|uniref:Uncharacterized protein n=2 Tax=Paenibacillus xerothermodurans TaxID=1977292 RepID=A0A2W1N9Q6_PAEXE|nr:hypothetical protein [Paenibacillus xerothermodurans]PZE20390.1 hypothetical protein CBW46_013195 [Paenibacillus xerothermodurans]
MQQSENNVCPWCQTEIVWDPEIGPEETCPHCLNELGDYRSVSLHGLQDTEQELDFDEDELDDEDLNTLHEYEEGAQRVLDTQEETPECGNCHSFMLFAGHRTMALGFVPVVPAQMKEPLLDASHSTKVFVCPSCFRIDHVLADEDRTRMVELLKQHGSK